MTDGEPTDTDDAVDHGQVVTGTSHSRALSTTELFAGARDRLARNPAVVVGFLLAGGVVAGIDWVQLHDPVPTNGYDGVQQGRVAVSFFVVVTILSRATVPASALVDLKRRWLALTVGLELLEVIVVVLASGCALARLLDVDLSAAALGRYALVVALLRVGTPRATFEGGAMVLAVPLLVTVFLVIVRLVPFPGLLIRGETIRTALSRSWALTRGHGWTLFAVVLALGLVNHLLTSVVVVGPVGSALVAAAHAGVVATLLARLSDPVDADRDRAGETGR